MAVLVPDSRYPGAVRASVWGRRYAPPSIGACIRAWLSSWELRRGLGWTGGGAYLYACMWYHGPWLFFGTTVRYAANMVASMFTQLLSDCGAHGASAASMAIVNYVLFGGVIPLLCARIGWRYLSGPDLMWWDRMRYRAFRRHWLRGQLIEVDDEVVAGLIGTARDLGLPLRENGDGWEAPTAVQMLGLYFPFVAGCSQHLQRRLRSGIQLSEDGRAYVLDALRRVGACVAAMERGVQEYALAMARLDRLALEADVLAEADLVPFPD